MASKHYFYLISHELYRLMDEGYDEDQLYKFDIGILEMFFSCLEVWDYTSPDEHRNEILRSIITHLKLIWVEEEDNEFESWPNHMHDFDPLIFGLERKIEQSKQLTEQFCEIYVSSFSMQCKFSTNHFNLYFIDSVYYNPHNLFTHKDSEVVPFEFENQIDILEDMLSFLSCLVSRLDSCIHSKELVEYMNFVHVFFYNAACLVCMYWAKEVNEEIAIEMNIALFDMLHKIKPCAADVTASYFAVLKTNNLLQSDESVFEGNTPASFVDFFFEHTILKDDFLILRERMIFLFTFLTDAPHENEEDVICSQIYALFREDAYLLLPISEMEEDFLNKNMLLSDFMIKIDVLTAKIIQHYCRPADSWNRLEAEKMNRIYFASVQRDLCSLNYALLKEEQALVHPYLMDIRFLRLFFQCFETWDDSDAQTRVQLSSIVTSLQRIWGEEYDVGLLSGGRLYAIRKEDIAYWEDLLDLELKEKFQMSKQEINAWLVSLCHFSFHCRPSTSNKIMKFLDSILDNMRDLVTYGACKHGAFKEQNEILEEKLLLLKNLLKLATNCVNSKNLEEFNMLAQVLANNASCLIYLYWANEANGEIPVEANLMLSDMLEKIKPNTPEVARMYIGNLKAICLQPYDYLLLEQTFMSFVDYFFEDLITPWKNDFQIIRDEVLFYLTFVHLHHHHTGNAEEIICSQLDVLFSDGVYDLLPFDDMKGDFSRKKMTWPTHSRSV